MNFEQVINGIVKYLNQEVYTGMNGWQEVLARVAVSRLIGNKDKIKTALIENPFVKTFAIIDESGNVDVDGLANNLREVIREKGTLDIEVPAFGKFSFKESDVDTLHRMITQGQ